MYPLTSRPTLPPLLAGARPTQSVNYQGDGCRELTPFKVHLRLPPRIWNARRHPTFRVTRPCTDAIFTSAYPVRFQHELNRLAGTEGSVSERSALC